MRLLETTAENQGKTGENKEKNASEKSLEVDLETIVATTSKGIKVLEVNVETKKIIFTLPKGFPVFLPNPDRRSFYAQTPLGRPAVGQTYLSFADKTRVVLEKKLVRELVVSQKMADLLEVGTLSSQTAVLEYAETLLEKALEKEASEKSEESGKSTSSGKSEKSTSSEVKLDLQGKPINKKRKKARCQEHKAKSCTCNKYGHLCHAVEKYGKKAHKFS